LVEPLIGKYYQSCLWISIFENWLNQITG
jgi:hypothetical protein